MVDIKLHVHGKMRTVNFLKIMTALEDLNHYRNDKKMIQNYFKDMTKLSKINWTRV